jgi:site-specific recombinase XerD
MISIKRHVQFLLDKEKDKQDAKIRYRIKWDKGKVVSFNVGYRANIDKWSTETQRCKNGTTHSKNKDSSSDINRTIQKMEDDISMIFADFETRNITPSEKDLRDAYRILTGKLKSVDDTNTISHVATLFITMSGKENTWTDSTIEKMSKLSEHMVNCFGDIPINDLPENGMTLFLLHLQKTGMMNSTITKSINNVKWLLRWAKANKLYKGDIHIGFSAKLKGSNGKHKTIIYLSWDELIKLYNLELTNKSLQNVRDVFCFCCFTGLRYSDAAKLRKTDLYDNYISVVTEKTDEAINIDLNNYSRAIIERHKHVPYPDDQALPIISNQKMNEYLFLRQSNQKNPAACCGIFCFMKLTNQALPE